MPGDRKAATAVAVEWIGKIDPSGKNANLIEETLSLLTNEEFESFVQQLEAGTAYLPINMENLNGNKITYERNLKVAKELNVNFFHRFWSQDPKTGIDVLSGPSYFCVYLPIRRQIQTLESKISLPEDLKHIDDLTDQPTGASKGSSISVPEMYILLGMDAERSAQELVGLRGGDLEAMKAMEKSLHETGSASIEAAKIYSQSAKSTHTLSAMLAGMHYDNNLVE